MGRDFAARYGRWALIAGASEGLGAEFARQLAARGLDLLLVARRQGPLEALAAQLRAQHGVEVRAVPGDLTDAAFLAALERDTAPLDVGLLVLNAALSPIGEFLARPPDEHQRLLDLNCRAPLTLSRALGPRLVARGRGGVVFLSSLAGLQGTALTAHYAASKAYLRVLAEGLWEELRPHGVDVLACVAGPTETPTWSASGARRRGLLKLPRVQPAEAVVRAALAGLGRAPVVFPGTMSSAIGFLMRRVLPTGTAVRAVSRMTRRMYE